MFFSSDPSIFSTVAFPPLGNSDCVFVSVSVELFSNSKGEAVFHRRTYDYYCVDWENPCNHLRKVLWEDIFKLDASAAPTEVCEWAQVEIDAYICQCKYKVKPHSSPWFSAACASAIAHRNHFFDLHQQNKSSEVLKDY